MHIIHTRIQRNSQLYVDQDVSCVNFYVNHVSVFSQ